MKEGNMADLQGHILVLILQIVKLFVHTKGLFLLISLMLPIHIVIILYHIQESQKRLMMNLFSITLLALMSILISC